MIASLLSRKCMYDAGLSGLKRQGHVTVNKAVISRIYIVVQMWPFSSEQLLVDEVNPH